jgi:hypothetical protein
MPTRFVEIQQERRTLGACFECGRPGRAVACVWQRDEHDQSHLQDGHIVCCDAHALAAAERLIPGGEIVANYIVAYTSASSGATRPPRPMAGLSVEPGYPRWAYVAHRAA